MNPAVALMIAQGLAFFIEQWRLHANKPKDWVPTDADWNEMLALNEKTAADYKAEARDAAAPTPPVVGGS